MAGASVSKKTTPQERADAHRRQVSLQIWTPLIGVLSVVLLLALAVFLGTVHGSEEVTRWANISTIYLLIPQILISLLMIVLLAFMVRGMMYVMHMMPDWLTSVQMFFAMAAGYVRKGCDRLLAPVISINSASHGVSGGFHAIFRRKSMSKTPRGAHER